MLFGISKPSSEKDQLNVLINLINHFAPRWRGDPKSLTKQQKKKIIEFVSLILGIRTINEGFASLLEQICSDEVDRLCEESVFSLIVKSPSKRIIRRLKYHSREFFFILKLRTPNFFRRERFADPSFILDSL